MPPKRPGPDEEAESSEAGAKPKLVTDIPKPKAKVVGGKAARVVRNLLEPATSLEECRERFAVLAEQFAEQRSFVRSLEYDEATARRDFIDPFFAALGWDVGNIERKFGKEREVVPEARATGQRDFPDYAFNYDGRVKFFVEAKRPAANIDAEAFIFQAKRYAYSRSVPACVLTNFENLRVYYAALEPKLDEPHVGRLSELDLSYDEYPANAELLWRVLGRPNVAEGSIESFLGEVAPVSRRGRLRHARTVDRAFLDDLSEWRRQLATAVVASNNIRDAERVAEAVQRILDRLVFIRVCEDRGIETQHVLRPILIDWLERKRTALYPGLVELFRRLEPEYNSHLFKKHFSEQLKFRDEAPLRRIIEGLYAPKSPYRFDALPIDILGTVYERFLGETIEFDDDGEVVIREKPEVRHAGGIVYTPRWVVREIVARTLGPRVYGKSPSQLENIRLLDPACGSGSFLLGAVEALFDAHLAWYRENALQAQSGQIVKEHRQDVFVDGAGELQLTVKKRREIVLNSVYGVDKDPQAVEVAELSLYLRILDGYGEQAFVKQKALFKGALLPDLSANMRTGNSLITPSEVPQEVVFDDERLRRARAFDWDSPTRGFGRVKAKGGFDVVIGNPPYIRIQELVKFAPDEVDVLRAIYPAASDGNFDIYLAFVEKSLRELKETGALGFILPLRWMKANYGKPLRAQLAKHGNLAEVIDFGADQVFEDVTTYTALQVFSRKRTAKIRYSWVRGGSDSAGLGKRVRSHERTYGGLDEEPWYVGISSNLSAVFDRLRASTHTLGSAALRISQGIKTGRDGTFVLHDATRRGNLVRGLSKESDRVIEVEAEACKWLIKSGQMRPYDLRAPTRVVLFPYDVKPDATVKLIPFDALRKKWPRLASYLEEHEATLRARERRKFDKNNEWHQFSRFQNMELPGLKKIVIADVVDRARFAFDDSASVCFMGGAAGGYGIVLDAPWDPWAVTAVLNSCLLEWMLRPPGFSDWFSGHWFSGEKRFIQNLPLPAPDHSAMKRLGEASRRLHQAHAKLSTSLGDVEADRLKTLIAAEEAIIDDLVFGAFEVSADDRAAIRHQVEQLRSLCAGDETPLESDEGYGPAAEPIPLKVSEPGSTYRPIPSSELPGLLRVAEETDKTPWRKRD